VRAPTSVTGRIGVTAVALVAAFLADVAVGATWPGRIAVVALAASGVLVIGAKSLLAPIVSRPAGARAGELGDPRDDLDDLGELEAVDTGTEPRIAERGSEVGRG
jgi:hypothetical protein